MPNRYNISKLLKDENGKRYLSRLEFPKIPIRDTDIFVRGIYGETFMNVAHRVYGDKDLWWVIARANHQPDSIYMVPGKEYRIPQNINIVLQEFEHLNR